MSPFQRGPDWQPREIWGYANRGTGLTRCGGCDGIWWQSGEYTSHCTGCHRTFTSLGGFDAHHREADCRRGFVCADPATLTREDGRPMFELIDKPRFGATIAAYWRVTGSDTAPLVPTTVETAPNGSECM